MFRVFTMMDTLPFIILGLHFVDKWYLAKAKLWRVYLLAILSSSCAVVYNCMLWFDMNSGALTIAQFTHSSVLVFAVNSAWTITMAIKGIVRLIKEDRKATGSLVT